MPGVTMDRILLWKSSSGKSSPTTLPT
jgi:hypothetical protein